MVPTNTVLNHRYRIVQQLGSGGMGAVYQAMDQNLNCVVAIKETFAATDEQRRAFKREAELLANLTHAALPRVTDHFTHDGGQFLVMQFVPGNDLAELLALRESPFPVEQVLEWADYLLDALEELHAYVPPVIHRDIKPSNLKLTPKGKIILLDFGLAKGAAGQMSTLGPGESGTSVYGYTRHYAPLEQIRGAGTDPRSDLYALGATLWSLLTGELPPDALARVGEKEDGKPDPLPLASEKNPQVPQAIAAVLHQAMALNRGQRPQSAAEMRRLLKDAARQAATEAAELARRREEEEARRRAEAEAQAKREAQEAARRAADDERRRREAEERRREEEEQKRRADEAEEQRRQEAEDARRAADEALRRREEDMSLLRRDAEEPQSARDASPPVSPRQHLVSAAATPSRWPRVKLALVFIFLSVIGGAIGLAVKWALQQPAGEEQPANVNQSAIPTAIQQTATPDAGQMNQPAGSPSPTATPKPSPEKEGEEAKGKEETPTNDNSTAPQWPQKRIGTIKSGDTSDGSRITITSDAPLNDYSTYRSGGRYYVVIPDANAPRAASGLRGRGFEDVQVTRRGNDAILSFKLQRGASVRVQQRFNRLDIEITAPAG